MKSECQINIKIIMNEVEMNEIINEIQNLSLIADKIKDYPQLNILYNHIKGIADTYDF